MDVSPFRDPKNNPLYSKYTYDQLANEGYVKFKNNIMIQFMARDSNHGNPNPYDDYGESRPWLNGELTLWSLRNGQPLYYYPQAYKTIPSVHVTYQMDIADIVQDCGTHVRTTLYYVCCVSPDYDKICFEGGQGLFILAIGYV